MVLDSEFQNLLSQVAQKIGDDAVCRLHPSDSGLPDQAAKPVSALYTDAVYDWAPPPQQRPLVLTKVTPLTVIETSDGPDKVDWRGARYQVIQAIKLDHVDPEWWMNDPDWQTGSRQYWRLDTIGSHSFFTFCANGGDLPSGWFSQGWF